MGDNANKAWEWHNNEVGVGYAAPGVVRQRQVGDKKYSIVDMTKKIEKDNDAKDKKHKRHKEKKDEKPKKKRKKSKHKTDDEENDSPIFNPFLQLLASQISDTTRHFSVD